jgi:hypothetical protein
VARLQPVVIDEERAERLVEHIKFSAGLATGACQCKHGAAAGRNRDRSR